MSNSSGFSKKKVTGQTREHNSAPFKPRADRIESTNCNNGLGCGRGLAIAGQGTHPCDALSHKER
eukprot:190477-Amphidinium_carterae.1